MIGNWLLSRYYHSMQSIYIIFLVCSLGRLLWHRVGARRWVLSWVTPVAPCGCPPVGALVENSCGTPVALLWVLTYVGACLCGLVGPSVVVSCCVCHSPSAQKTQMTEKKKLQASIGGGRQHWRGTTAMYQNCAIYCMFME